MKDHSFDNSQEKWAHHDLNNLAEQGRVLHDQAVYDFFSGLAKKVLQLFKKLDSESTHASDLKPPTHRGLSSSK